MTDLVLPYSLRQAKSSFRYIDSTGVTRGAYTGVPQTTNYGGDRIGCSIDFTAMGGRQSSDQSLRAQMQAFFMSLRGKTNRVYLIDSSYSRRGLFPASELLTNADFSNGVTGWTAGPDASISAVDGSLRVKRKANATSGAAVVNQTLSGLSIGLPYAWRTVISAVRGTASLRATTNADFFDVDIANLLNPGYRRTLTFPTSTSMNVYADNTGTSISIAGDYFDLSFSSLSRCLVTDSGSNRLIRSDESDNAAWTRSGLSSVTANAGAAPDGQITADAIVENASTSFHYIEQGLTGIPSSAADYAYCVAVSPSARSWVWLEMSEGGATSTTQYFQLTGSGTVGSGSTGAGFSNRRCFIAPLGNGWYLCCIVARKTSSATTMVARTGAATADNTGNYLGTSSTALSYWRHTFVASSVPVRLTQSTTVAVSAGTQNGTTIYVKGGRAAGEAALDSALLIGDQIEIDGQLKILTAPVDIDATGGAFLQFSPPLRRAVADNTPVIVHRPMSRFLLAGDSSGWDNVPGVFSQASIDLEEAFG